MTSDMTHGTTLKYILITTFAGSVVMANVLAAKLTWLTLPYIGGVAIPAGFIAFGVAYLCSDLLVEFYGGDVAHKVVNATIATLTVAYALIYISIWMPTAPFWPLQEQFTTVLGSSGSIILASIIALGIAQHFDVRLFERILQRTGRGHKWVRNCASTTASQALDTVLFVTLGFGVFPLLGLGGDAILGWELVSIILGQYIVKLGVVVADTLPFYAVTKIPDTKPNHD